MLPAKTQHLSARATRSVFAGKHRIGLCLLGLAALIFTSLPSTAQESRYPGKWKWSALHTNQIRNLTKSCGKRSDGFWELNNSGIQTQTDISGRLTADNKLPLRHHRILPRMRRLP